MPSPKVKEIMRMFMGNFQGEPAQIPIALQHQSTDVVFTALIEDDEIGVGPMPMPTDSFYEGEMGGGLGDDMGMMADMMMNDMGMMSQATAPPMGPGGPEMGGMDPEAEAMLQGLDLGI